MLLPRLWLFVATAFAALTVQELKDLQQNSVVSLDDTTFFPVLTGARDYYVALLFTALDEQYACTACQKFDPVFSKIASSYEASNPGKNGIFFMKTDFPQNKKVFAQLQMTQVPFLWVFPPSQDPTYNVSSPHFNYQISEKSFEDSLHFANFVSKLVSANIVVQEDFDFQQFVKYFGGTFAVVLLLKKQVLSKLPKGTIFKLASVVAIVILTSGYMFTMIRGIPLLNKNDKGEIMYFSGGTHWQFGSETFIVSAIYLGFVALINALVVVIPRLENRTKRNTLTICAVIGVLWLTNQLTDIYLVKDPSYPYALSKLL